MDRSREIWNETEGTEGVSEEGDGGNTDGGVESRGRQESVRLTLRNGKEQKKVRKEEEKEIQKRTSSIY